MTTSETGTGSKCVNLRDLKQIYTTCVLYKICMVYTRDEVELNILSETSYLLLRADVCQPPNYEIF